MKLKDVRDMDKFFSLIDKYEGSVKLVTERGDCMNLRSKLLQFVIMEKIATDNDVQEGSIVFKNR